MSTLKDKNKEVVMEKLIEGLRRQGELLQQDEELSIQDKLIQMDVILDVLHFIQDYDENIKVLNNYWLHKEKRFKTSNEEIDEI